ncbi:hypothetical protein GCM10011340_20660 [Roseivirga thermotolerans]|uniref:Uncharacterized protein n=1 Tax=Roseivirga thermotolerans TaxID=1758176 RepID=A0ABQ3I645_9BACT|nr:hypothetical protein GCM10011340_20660 [Roseivirga thermotolerans]
MMYDMQITIYDLGYTNNASCESGIGSKYSVDQKSDIGNGLKLKTRNRKL